jgi:hypothetical protein
MEQRYRAVQPLCQEGDLGFDGEELTRLHRSDSLGFG